MPKRTITYAVVDAFTDQPFKGNTAAICLLEDIWEDEQWMQSVATEFNTSITVFLVRAGADDGSAGKSDADAVNSRFHIRWFTPVRESELCGHGTLAAAHYLISSGHLKCDAIDFLAKSGVLTAKKIVDSKQFSTSIEKCTYLEMPSVPETLNGASINNVLKTISDSAADLIVELNSSEEVVNVHPNIAELVQCAGRGVAVTGTAPAGCSYDFFTRFFCPKYGLNEDPVCASVHCALAPYWGKKLGKQLMTAFMASSRSGILYL
uniref:Uncharacterized protein n=1 Tax=Leersia perrieri TaxID=77586 RepID=A0A0D9W2S9_9ORYZ